MSQSPELTGGAGFTFEGSVGALYLSSLLAEGYAPGIDNRAVCRVAFQQRDFGEPLDDIIVDFRTATGELARLSLQAKRSLVISQAKTNADFREVVRDCWLTLAKPDFRRQQDRYGVAVGSVAKDKARAVNALCEFARESLTVDHFAARFAPAGNASNEVRAVRTDVEALLLVVRGEPCSDVEVKDFLAHFVLIEFDFLHDGAVDPPQAMSRVRDCLVPAEAGKAPLVWSHLVNLARTSAGKAGEYDRARLVRSVSEVAGLRVAVSLKLDLDKLVSLARSYVDGIQDDIGGVKLDRPSLSASLDDKLAASRLIQIKGLPGSGKSVLLRQRVERALGLGPVLFLKADQIDGRNWIGFASAHGLSGAALQDLLAEIGATGTPVLYIDAIDRVEKENQSVVLDVLRQIIRSQVLDNWRIVVSVRDAGIEMLRNWMADILDNVSVASVSVGSLDDDEAEVIATAKPQLRSLLFGTQAVRDVVRRPFFTKILNQNYTANANGPQFEPASEVDLIENWWARGGYSATGQDAIARQRAIVELAGLRSRKLSEPIALRLLSQPSVALLDQLILDGILQEVRRGHSVRFSHDIFFEWAFFHALTDRNDDWLEEIRSCGEPPAVSRVVELLAQWEYSRGQGWGAHLARVAGSQMRSQWTRAWLLGPMGISNFSADEGQFAKVAFEGDFRFLKKALVWFQAEKTIPNQNILASNLPQDQRQRFADLLGWPADFSAWRRLISFLLHHVSEIPVRLYPDILSVFEVWQNAFADLQLRTSQAILEKSAEWLAELDAAEAERSWDRPSERWGSISGWDEFRKSLSNLVLKGSRSEPRLVEDYLRRVMASKRLLRDRFEDVVAFSPRLSQTHPKLLVDFALAYLKQELPDDRLRREREEAARNAECRRQVLAKPEAERTRFEQLMADAPSPLIGGGISHFERDELCVDRDFRNFWPESPLREPFHSLFQSSPDEALRLLRELCNHAMTAWRQFHRYQDYYDDAVRTPLPLEINFPWGAQKFWGTDRIYQWFRAFSAPKPLGCGFMALEEWCLAELGRGRSVDELIRVIVEGNECIGVLGSAVMLALHTEARSEAIFQLVTSQRLLHADFGRMGQDLSASSVHLMGFTDNSSRDHIEAIKVADARDVRRKQLAWLIPIYVFGGEQYSERTKAAFRDFVNKLPFQYEQDLDVEEVRQALIAQAERYVEMADTANYRLQRTKEPNEVAVIHVSPSASRPEAVTQLEEATRYLKTSSLVAWASEFFEKGVIGSGFTSQSAVEYARSIDSDVLFDESAGGDDLRIRRGAVTATAAMVIHGRSAYSAPDLEWARDVLDRALGCIEKRDTMWTPLSIDPWHHAIFVARGLAAELRQGTGNKSTATDLLSLVGHPLEAVSFAALGEACQLWSEDPKLVWAALSMAFSLCHLPPRSLDARRGPGAPMHLPKEVGAAFKAAGKYYRKGKGWSAPPLPPPAWIRVDDVQGRGRRYRHRHRDYGDEDLVNPSEVWGEPEVHWYSSYAAKILPLIPVEKILVSDAKGPILDFVAALLDWTNQKNEPPWLRPGRHERVESDLMEWTGALGRALGQAAGLLPLGEVRTRILDPILALEDDACWALLSPFCSTYICAYVYDAQVVPEDAVAILDLSLGRLLAAKELKRASYRGGEFTGFDQPRLARTLMFVSVERAALAARYVNGDWSEIDRIFPLVDRFVRAAGWAAPVMSSFLTLCERAKQSYPTESFADEVLLILGDGGGPLKGWHGTSLPARIAGLVQHFADRDSPMSLALAQKFLRILDLLVDMGDRRSAALQLGEAFREVRVGPP